MFKVYLFTKESSFYQSYHSDIPFLFYVLLIIYCIMLKYYFKACGSPGYAKDEINETNLDSNCYFCEYCQINVPIRTSHCNICQKCILRRDHHCPWTNNCVGRDNHFDYFIFTLFALIIEFVPLIDTLFHLIFCYLNIVKSSGFLMIVLCYTLFIIATCFACTLTFKLVYQNIITIMHNITIWERLRRDRISYLKNFQEGSSPFDNGVIKNIIEFCSMRKKKIKWKIESDYNYDKKTEKL